MMKSTKKKKKMWNSGLINKNNTKQGFCYGAGSLEFAVLQFSFVI